MWQRIQTLYLGISTILTASMFFSNFATVLGPDGTSEKIGYGEYVPYLLFLIMLTAANVTAIATFKARMLQMRVCILTAILQLAFQLWLAVDIIRHWNEMVFSITAVFPLVAIILDLLAARGIFMDEAIVHAASHLRGDRRKRDGRKR